MNNNYDKLIFELSQNGRKGYSLPKTNIEQKEVIDLVDSSLVRGIDLNLPEVSENEVVRHYTNLSNKNFGVDTNLYPLGSCTMKYNPKINEEAAKLPENGGDASYYTEKQVTGARSRVAKMKIFVNELLAFRNAFSKAPESSTVYSPSNADTSVGTAKSQILNMRKQNQNTNQ